MKKFLALLALLLIPATALAETNTAARWRNIDFAWENHNSGGKASAGYRVLPDSMTASIRGGPSATEDTTVWINMNDIAWGNGTHTGTGAMILARVNITGTNTTTDTMTIICDAQMDGGVTVSGTGTYSNMLGTGAAAYEAILSTYFTGGLAQASTGSIPVGARKIRFRVKGDNNVGMFLNAKLSLCIPMDEENLNGTRIKWVTKAIPWWNFNSGGSVALGYRVQPDSMTASINGIGLTSGTIDTTAWINLSDCAWSGQNNVTLTTAYSQFKIMIDGTQTTTDTLFAFADYSMDPAIGSIVQTTALSIVTSAQGTYDNVLSGFLSTDIDAQPTLSAVALFGAKWVRFRVRADGDNATSFLNARFYICYPAYVE